MVQFLYILMPWIFCSGGFSPFFLPRLKDAANKRAAGSETSSQVVNVNAATTRDGSQLLYCSGGRACNKWSWCNYARLQCQWCLPLDFCINFLYIWHRTFSYSPPTGLPADEESTHQDYRTEVFMLGLALWVHMNYKFISAACDTFFAGSGKKSFFGCAI